MTAVVSIKHPAPRFEGQTKTKLDNQDAAKAVSKVLGEQLVLYFDRNLETLKNVLSCAEKAAKIRRPRNGQKPTFSQNRNTLLTPTASWPIVKKRILPSVRSLS